MSDFDEWAFQQVVVKGNEISSVKNNDGENVKWINTTTKEEFILIKQTQE